MKTILPKLISFGLAFVAGWWGVRERVDLWGGATDGAPSSRTAGQRPKDQPVTAESLVAKHTARSAGELKKAQTQAGDWQMIRDEQMRKFESLKDSFVLDSDPGKQYEAAMSRYANDPQQWAEPQLISLAWLRQDADGFLAFLAKAKGEGSGSVLKGAVKERCAELSREQSLDLLGKLEAAGQWAGSPAVFSHLVSSTLASGGLADAIALATQLQPRQRDGFMRQLAMECPEQLRPEAFKWFADQGQTDCIRSMVYRIRETPVPVGGYAPGKSWFGEMVERFPETRESLVGSGLYQELMMNAWFSLPAEQGLAEMVAGMPGTISDETKRVKALEFLCGHAAGAALSGQRDLGPISGDDQLSMEQLVNRMGPRAKELFAIAPDVMLKAIFPELAMRDPEAAMKMVASLEPKAREQLVLKAAASPRLMSEGDAERLLKLFTASPPNPEQGPLQARFMVWGQITDNAYRTYGDSYPAWLLALPHSVDRDMALSHLAQAVKATDPELGARLVAAKSQTPPAR